MSNFALCADFFKQVHHLIVVFQKQCYLALKLFGSVGDIVTEFFILAVKLDHQGIDPSDHRLSFLIFITQLSDISADFFNLVRRNTGTGYNSYKQNRHYKNGGFSFSFAGLHILYTRDCYWLMILNSQRLFLPQAASLCPASTGFSLP